MNVQAKKTSAPVDPVNASAIAGHTSALATMFACTEKPSPTTWPASSTHSSPV